MFDFGRYKLKRLNEWQKGAHAAVNICGRGFTKSEKGGISPKGEIKPSSVLLPLNRKPWFSSV